MIESFGSSARRSAARAALLGALVALTLVASPAIADRVPIDGLIVDDEGAPVAAATVELYAYPSSYAIRARHLLDALPEPVATTKTGADGRFALMAPGIGMWALAATKRGHVDVRLGLVPLLEGERLPPLELPAAERLTVSAVDDAGRPVPAALLIVDPTADRRRDPSTLGHVRRQGGRVDDDGRLMIPVRAGEEHHLRVTAAGYGVAETRHRGGGRVRLVLEPAAATRRLRVVDGDGKPRAGTLLVRGRPSFTAAIAGDDGRLDVALPAAGKLTVALYAPDSGWKSVTLTAPAGDGDDGDDGDAGEAPPLEVVLERAAVLRGRVIDPAREPIAGVLVWQIADPAGFVVSDARGGYALAVPPADRIFFRAAAPGYLPVGEPVQDAGRERTAPTLVLTAAARVAGVVVDAGGRAVADTVIQVGVSRGTVGTRSATDGRFVLSPLPPASDLVLRARRRGYAPARLELPALEPGGETAELRVELRRSRTAFGFVVDAGEVPIAGADAILVPSLAGDHGWRGRRRWPDEKLPRAASDGEGRFVFADLAPGRYDLHLRRHGFAPVTIPAIEVAGAEDGRGTDSGEPVDLGTVLLETGATLEGWTGDADGAPLEGVEIHVESERADQLRAILREERGPVARSGVDGRFVVHDLLPGQSVRLAAKRAGYGGTRLTAAVPPDEPVRIVLRPATRVAGVVHDPRGRPVAGALVRLSPRSSGSHVGGSPHTRTGDDGHFELADVAAGSWQLTAMAEGYQQERVDGLEVTPGAAAAPLEIVLRPGMILTGRVLAADGTPLAKAQITAVGGDLRTRGGATGSARSDGEGRYRLDSLPAGPVLVAADHQAYRRRQENVELRAGENVLDLVLDRGFEIAGQVVDADGEPVAGARVILTAIERGDDFGTRSVMHMGTPAAISGGDGSFVVGGLEDGRYELTARRPGHAEAHTERPIAIDGASVGGVVLRLRRGARIAGRVLGAPLDDLARVEIQAHGTGPGSASRTARPDFDGAFALERLTPGEWRLYASLGSGSPRVQKTVVLEPGVEELRVDLDLGGELSLAGRVLTGDGAPLANASVNVFARVIESSAHARTDTTGRFRVERLRAGTWEVVAHHPSGRNHARRTVELTADLELELRIDDATLRGRVVDATDGSPLVGAELSVEQLTTDRVDAALTSFDGPSSGPGGAFRIDGLSPGRYRLRVSHPGHATTTVETMVAETGASPVEVRLEPASGFELTVRLAGGGVPATVVVAALDAAGQIATVESPIVGENGRVVLDRLPDGFWTLLVAATGAATASVEVAVPGPPVEVRLPAIGQLRLAAPEPFRYGLGLQVRDPAGRLYRHLHHRSVQDRFYLRPDDLLPLPAGIWQLELTLPDGTPHVESVTIVAGGETSLDLDP